MTEIEHRRLRSALEFAVAMAAEASKRRVDLDPPAELGPYLNAKRVPNRALGPIRRAIEGDDRFRARLAAGALPDLVDDVGRLWLQRPDGWEQQIASLLAVEERAAEVERLGAHARRADERREAAERAQGRMEEELVAATGVVERQRDLIDELEADVAKLTDELAELRIELTDVRNEVRHARDRERAAVERLEIATAERESAVRDRDQARSVRDDAIAGRAETSASVAEIAAAAAEAATLAERLTSLLPAESAPDRGVERRSPLALPGGILSSSAEAAEHLVRTDAAVLVDGYNVTKSVWPSRTLQEQRSSLLDAVENLARRYGTDVAVFFDGADVVGAHAGRRRMVRVVYSPADVIADDLIRDEVRRLPLSRPVVVVTDDKEIVRDVRADGANTVPTNAFVAIL